MKEEEFKQERKNELSGEEEKKELKKEERKNGLEGDSSPMYQRRS